MSGLAVSHYRIIEKLGGGIGSVQKGEGTELHRHLAIKVVHNEFVHDPNGCYPSTTRTARIAPLQ